MVQDIPVQDIHIPGQDESLPQMDPKPEMGAAAVAADFATPPLLRQIPSPAPSKTATDNGGSVPLSPLLMQIVEACTQAMRGETQQMGKEMKEEIKNNTNKMEANTKGMREEMKEMRGEMRQMGHGLQTGIMALAYDETQTARKKMAAPRATTNELGGSAPAGEDRVIWETRRTRSVEVSVTKW